MARALDPHTAWVVDAYERYFDYVWALVGRLGVPPSSIEDVVQEVFVVLYQRRAEFRAESSIKTWLHGICLNVARRQREKLGRRAHRALPSDALSPGSSPETLTACRTQLERLDRLLAELPDKQREVFILFEVAQLPAPEVAALLGIRINTAYSRLRLARRRIEHRLRAIEHGECDDDS